MTRFAPRPRHSWQIAGHTLHLGTSTLVMAVLNVTPDSFSDGGLFASHQAAITHGLRLLDEGAHILDIGGESTRPGATRISPQQEQDRILPVLHAIHHQRPHAILSVDTSRAVVARAAVAAGAHIVNDVSGLLWDHAMAATCAELHCGVIAMHTRGTPDSWQHNPPLPPEQVLPLVRDGLQQCLARAHAAGIPSEAIVLDPGFGFGKAGEENYHLLARLPELAQLHRPILAGLSRKSFLGQTLSLALNQPPPAPSQRATATLAATVAAVLAGAHIVRVHEATPTLEAAAIADALLQAT